MDINININYNNKKKSIKADFILLGILLVAAFLRLYHLGYQSAWLDEIHTLIESSPKLTFKEFDDIIMQREGIPHFYFLTIRFLSELFGHGIIIARMVSAVAGIASVYVIYLTAKELFTKRTGYIAALLLTVNLYHIEHSQEARSYALLTFFIIVSYYRLILLLKKPNIKNAILLGIFSGLITNAHPIGMLNVASIYLSLLVVLLLAKTRKEQITLFKFSFLSGIVALFVFYPVYQIVSKVSDIQSFWIPEATFQNIKQVFVDLLGRSEILFLGGLLLLMGYLVFAVIKLTAGKKKTSNQSNLKLSFILLVIWLLINIGVIVVKSYTGVSIILARYFIGVLPALVLGVAFAIDFISHKLIRNTILTLIVLFSLYNVFIVRKYYTEISKAQFDKVTAEIIKNNHNDDKVFSSFGWLMSYYINADNTKHIVTEIKLGDYITSVRNNAVKMESFWYMDGNYRPYEVSVEDQRFLDENYILDYQIDKYDAWARHYKTRKEEIKDHKTDLFLNEFTPLNLDGNGNLMFFESSTVKSPVLHLEKGTYELTINGNSLPATPIHGENAHFIVKIDDKEIANYFLSEKIADKEKKIRFQNNIDRKATLSLVFDNDIATDKLDRNAVIYSLDLKKID